jgi:hypothetical protein
MGDSNHRCQVPVDRASHPTPLGASVRPSLGTQSVLIHGLCPQWIYHRCQLQADRASHPTPLRASVRPSLGTQSVLIHGLCPQWIYHRCQSDDKRTRLATSHVRPFAELLDGSQNESGRWCDRSSGQGLIVWFGFDLFIVPSELALALVLVLAVAV